MSMRLDLDFSKPLKQEQRLSLKLALAALAKSKRVSLVDGGRGAIVIGEAMSCSRVRQALAEMDLGVEAIRSSLNEDEDAVVDETQSLAAGNPSERLKPIGR